MKVLLIFKSGKRYVGDTLGMVLPEHPSNIEKRVNLLKATDDEIEELKNNPHNDTLIEEIKKRTTT